MFFEHLTIFSVVRSTPILHGEFSSELTCENFKLLATTHGVATISRLLRIVSLFCKRTLQKRLYLAKETYNCKEPCYYAVASCLFWEFLAYRSPHKSSNHLLFQILTIRRSPKFTMQNAHRAEYRGIQNRGRIMSVLQCVTVCLVTLQCSAMWCINTELTIEKFCRMLRSKPCVRDTRQKFCEVSSLLNSPSVELTIEDFGHMLSSQSHVCGSC